MQVISIISTKGGVGKTTTAANLGGLVADAGLRVLRLLREGESIGAWQLQAIDAHAVVFRVDDQTVRVALP